MATHQEVSGHLRAEYRAERAKIKAMLDSADVVDRMAADHASWEEAARQGLMATTKAGHVCGNANCPLDDWQDEV